MKELLVFGGGGLVGSEFIRSSRDCYKITAPGSTQVDLKDPRQVRASVNKSPAEIVVNMAAYTKVDEAERERGDKEGGVYKLNAAAVRHLALACGESDKFLIHVSTAFVFDGIKSDAPYNEDEPKN